MEIITNVSVIVEGDNTSVGVFSFVFQSNQSTPSPWQNSTTANTTINHHHHPFNCSSIADEHIILRAKYFYGFFGSLGFIAGCFLLYSFTQTYRAHRRLAWLECLLWVFCGFQLLLLLLSLHVVAYLHTTILGCAVLSFFINATSLCGLLVLVLMAYVLTLDPPSHARLRKPGVCAALVILSSVLISLLLAGLRGPSNNLQVECFMDPAIAGVSYAAVKFCLAFLIPFILQVGLLIGGCVRQWKSRGRFLSGSEEGPMFLAVTVVMFSCLLFYNAVLVREAQKEMEAEAVLLSIAEFVLFSGSSASLLLVLVMHRPCRESLHGVFRQLRDCCRRPGHTQPNRNIIAPHIEITDTLQDIES